MAATAVVRNGTIEAVGLTVSQQCQYWIQLAFLEGSLQLPGDGVVIGNAGEI